MPRLSSAPYKISIKVPGAARRFETVIGLEVHARLKTNSKLFCPCPNEYGNPPNANTCPVCTGMPGALPSINEHAVTLGMRAALALNMAINPASVFARKSYFYPDLPKGYQLSQFDQPLGTQGFIDLTIGGITTRIRITRAHLEEDAGKLVHTGSKGIVGASGALVDLNRGGTPLLEIVSEPDLRSPEQAALYLRSLRDILVFAGVSDGNMEEGSLRCDANISLRPIGSNQLGTKVEIKNLNSYRFLELALTAESRRQATSLLSGKSIVQETRTYNPATGETSSMRSKEDADDYRYFPEPDLLPLNVTAKWITKTKNEMPELPMEKLARYRASGLKEDTCNALLADINLANFFDKVTSLLPIEEFNGFAKWFLNALLGETKRLDKKLEELSPAMIAEIYLLLSGGAATINGTIALLQKHLMTGEKPAELLQQLELTIIKDEETISLKAREIIASHPDIVVEYHAGKTKAISFLIGQIVKALGGNVDSKQVALVVSKILKGE